MKLNFNFQFSGLDGKELSGESAGRIIASYLSSQNKGNSIKLWDWAMKCYQGNPLDLDPTDTEVLVGMIETSDDLTVLGKAQILSYINSVKDAEKKNK
jgi:hypothetical protein